MKTFAYISAIALMLFFGGCRIERQPAPADTFFMLNVSPDVAPRRAENDCLRLRPVNVQAPFAGTALIYRTGEMTYEKDYYNQFLVAPDIQLGNLLDKWLRATGAAGCLEDTDDGGIRLTL